MGIRRSYLFIFFSWIRQPISRWTITWSNARRSQPEPIFVS